ncbi:hypothetical protein B0O99DRAFT_500652 [Bisporella sp. PMI_857]|nr:hypothetical protein B0O99DRAFT_500652 [Bisporella sp. PMI_857]
MANLLQSTSSPPPFSFDTLPLPKVHAGRRTLSTCVDSRNSSLNTKEIWASDYFDTEDEDGEFVREGHWISPPPAAVTTSSPLPKSVAITDDEESFPARQPRTHQRSLTSLLPFGSKSREGSPKKLVKARRSPAEDDDYMPYTGDRERAAKTSDTGRGGLASWFSGSSAPVTIGVPVSSPDSEDSAKMAAPARRPTLPSLNSNSSITQAKAPTTSMFNFFSSPKTPSHPSIQLPQHLLDSDELLTLDINSVLYPSGSPGTFSPAAFKNLQIQAEGLLQKMQTAYKFLKLENHELSAENSAQAEELEESETRAQCLKTQLDDIAHKVTEQDKVIESLVLELAQEKQLRAEEKEAREKSISLVRESRKKAEKRGSCCSGQGEDLHINTDLEHKSWRNSGGSTDFESDTDSAASVFSRPRSPTLTTRSAMSTTTVDSMQSADIMQAEFGRVVVLKDECSGVQRPKMVQQPSTFQKIMGGMQNKGEVSEGANSCRNCSGNDSSVAWDTVGLLRAENRGLKERVSELEGAVEGALDLCAGLVH